MIVETGQVSFKLLSQQHGIIRRHQNQLQPTIARPGPQPMMLLLSLHNLTKHRVSHWCQRHQLQLPVFVDQLELGNQPPDSNLKLWLFKVVMMVILLEINISRYLWSCQK
ncbi:hypothetical protein PoB_002900800 [Plakobranchus ocellatus]|uniref:Uncharacterized protein n=1 Tax=Plakobranchus ocellatus TaxID=259542 RepID=A0AAV4A798_9GAST|nr:hypothetical protein PoB_002900800 [Plakobranchus ocellatus]